MVIFENTLNNYNRRRQSDGSWSPVEEYHTTSTYDIRGNLLTVKDALGRVAFRHIYDLANRPLRIESIDAGIKRTVLDPVGNVIEQRDSKGALILHAYDELNRPIRLWARDGVGQRMTLREYLLYGDSLNEVQAKATNLLGKLYKYYDEAGLLTFEEYDFKGNVLEKYRQVIKDDQILSVFDTASTNNWQVQAYRVDWQPTTGTAPADMEAHEDVLLDGMKYEISITYDALSRVKTMQYPQDVEGNRKILRQKYNHAGALEHVALDDKAYVEHIAYNAKGQRTLIAYGNGVMTRYAYDEQIFRLIRMRTERYAKPDESTYHPTGIPLQDFAYSYDLVGNILSIRDRTPGCGVINTLEGSDVLNRIFAYDPLYRLISATGRECNNIPRPRPWADDPRCGFNSGNHGTPDQDNAPSLTAIYREEYAYDPAGNMVSLRHSNNGNSWIRHFGMDGFTPHQWEQAWQNHLGAEEWVDPPGNRLTHVGDGQPDIIQNHFYDSNGNTIQENTERHLEWDHSDHLRIYRTQVANAETSIYAHYLYDASGQRVKKLVRKQSGQIETTIYIDGIFEHHRIIEAGTMQENNTLHVMDNQARIGVVRVGTPFHDDATPMFKYYLGDHLGSSNVVIDDLGTWVNREEYTPYGETSFGSFAKKGYRFTGKERDEESELYYYGARYYTPWLGRWVSPDPLGLADGNNMYVYAHNNPILLIDKNGTQAETPKGFDKIDKIFDTASKWTGGGEGPLSSVLKAAGGVFKVYFTLEKKQEPLYIHGYDIVRGSDVASGSAKILEPFAKGSFPGLAKYISKGVSFIGAANYGLKAITEFKKDNTSGGIWNVVRALPSIASFFGKRALSASIALPLLEYEVLSTVIIPIGPHRRGEHFRTREETRKKVQSGAVDEESRQYIEYKRIMRNRPIPSGRSRHY